MQDVSLTSLLVELFHDLGSKSRISVLLDFFYLGRVEKKIEIFSQHKVCRSIFYRTQSERDSIYSST